MNFGELPPTTWAWVGLDPGLDGALAVVTSDGVRRGQRMPLKKRSGLQIPDCQVIGTFFRYLQVQGYTTLAACEEPFVKKGQGGALTIGRNWGILLDACYAAGVEPRIVKPIEWQKVILKGVVGDKAKDRALEYSKNKFADIDLRANPKAKEPHDGIIDALCIAEWLQLETGG